MNFIKRAFLSVKARKGKTLLQLFIFSAICVLVLSGLSIQTAADKAADLARQQLGGDVTLQVDMTKAREQMKEQMESGERERPSFTSTPITVENAEELTSYEHIKGYNFYSTTTALASDFEPIESSTTVDFVAGNNNGPDMPGGMSQGDVSIEGVSYTDSVSDFMDSVASLVDGRHITIDDLDSNVAIIEQTLAEDNELAVGDTITITNPSDKDTSLTLEIVGIYETTSTGSNQGMNFTALNPYNKIYVPYTAASTLKGEDYAGTIDSAIYYLEDAQYVDSFIKEAEENSSIDFNTFALSANTQLYDQMMEPIENVASFSENVVYLVSIAGAIILGLIVMMGIRERKYEMGVLLALGEKKWKLIGQFVVEILLVAILAIGIASISGNVVANAISDQLLTQETAISESSSRPESFGGPMGGDMGKMLGQPSNTVAETTTEFDVSVTAKDIGLLSGIGLLITFIAALIPSLSVLRLQPKTILSRQD
ncbi:ABC transporter permease [Bacillus sp. AGMB 02131]|uniref:ABC transporter permease n=1 Tax=Peribacillus faecalis TaxID=2772559 RepID=A0A927CWS0_9BACI|nr:ABC transporter permease [Peribacillus faecalis]MBD3107380.1 ABC transporter permease [Peribacillus faecalis]